MIITSLLILLAIGATVIGTYWDQSTRGKQAIIALAVMAGLGAIHQSYQTEQESAFAKRAFDALVRAVDPPEQFTRTLRGAVSEYALQRDHWMSQQESTSPDVAIFFLTRDGAMPQSGRSILLLRETTIEELFHAYVSDKSLPDELERALQTQWGGDDVEANWNEFVGTVTDITRMTASYHPKWSELQFKVYSEYYQPTLTVRLVVHDKAAGFASIVQFDRDQIRALRTKPTHLRDQAAFEFVSRQLNETQSWVSVVFDTLPNPADSE